MESPSFWDNPEAAKPVVTQLSAVKSLTEPAEQAYKDVQDISDLFELACEEDDEPTIQSIEADLQTLQKRCD